MTEIELNFAALSRPHQPGKSRTKRIMTTVGDRADTPGRTHSAAVSVGR